MKKHILCVLLAAAMLTGCSQNQSQTQPQTHTHAAGEWRCDLESHWQLCADCGEEMNKASHTVEEELCSGCGAEVCFYEDDNTTEFTYYNEQDDWIYSPVYLEDGTMDSIRRAEYSYDENGQYKSVRHYRNDVLTYEILYTVNADGKHVPTEESYFYEDGSKGHTAYNEFGDWVQSTFTAADGTVETASRAEYEYHRDGTMLSYRAYRNDMLETEIFYSTTPDGEHYAASERFLEEDGSWQLSLYDDCAQLTDLICYNADGSVSSAHYFVYSEDRSTYVESYYEGETILYECTCATDEEGWPILLRAVNYSSDGSCTVEERDIHDNETLYADYDGEGNLISEIRYENEYDAEGNRTLRRTYVDGRLSEEMTYTFGSDEDGSWSSGRTSAVYHEDGSKTLYSYAEDDTWAEEITYDAAGAVTDTVRYEYDFDEDGESLGSRTFRNGKITEEVQAVREENEEGIRILWTYYEDDGSKTVQKYADDFEFLGEITYDAAGNVLSES